jgi:hypothetical protein
MKEIVIILRNFGFFKESPSSGRSEILKNVLAHWLDIEQELTRRDINSTFIFVSDSGENDNTIGEFFTKRRNNIKYVLVNGSKISKNSLDDSDQPRREKVCWSEKNLMLNLLKEYLEKMNDPFIYYGNLVAVIPSIESFMEQLTHIKVLNEYIDLARKTAIFGSTGNIKPNEMMIEDANCKFASDNPLFYNLISQGTSLVHTPNHIFLIPEDENIESYEWAYYFLMNILIWTNRMTFGTFFIFIMFYELIAKNFKVLCYGIYYVFQILGAALLNVFTFIIKGSISLGKRINAVFYPPQTQILESLINKLNGELEMFESLEYKTVHLSSYIQPKERICFGEYYNSIADFYGYQNFEFRVNFENKRKHTRNLTITKDDIVNPPQQESSVYQTIKNTRICYVHSNYGFQKFNCFMGCPYFIHNVNQPRGSLKSSIKSYLTMLRFAYTTSPESVTSQYTGLLNKTLISKVLKLVDVFLVLKFIISFFSLMTISGYMSLLCMILLIILYRIAQVVSIKEIKKEDKFYDKKLNHLNRPKIYWLYILTTAFYPVLVLPVFILQRILLVMNMMY